MNRALFFALMIGWLFCLCSFSTAFAMNRSTGSSDLLVSGCATDLSEQELDGLLVMDFSEGIAQCEFISPYDEDGTRYATWLPSSIQQPELTEGEGRILGMTFTPPDGRRCIAETLGHVSRFYNHNNRMPLSGAELMNRVLTRDGLAGLLEMDPGEQY